jgi:hypothetical protein
MLLCAVVGAATCRCLNCVFDLILAGKVEVVEVAITTNMETMQNEPAAAAKHQEEQAARLVPLLRLTEQQQELIPIGVRLYYDLLAGIHQERQEINAQMTAVLEADRDVSSSSSSAAAASDSSSIWSGAWSATSRAREQHLADRRARLQQHQELTNRLNLLLQKEVRVNGTHTLKYLMGGICSGQPSAMQRYYTYRRPSHTPCRCGFDCIVAASCLHGDHCIFSRCKPVQHTADMLGIYPAQMEAASQVTPLICIPGHCTDLAGRLLNALLLYRPHTVIRCRSTCMSWYACVRSI